MKIGAIIQVRFNSSRLEGKVLKHLPFDGEDTLLSHIHRRLQKSQHIDEIIVATSVESDDDVIEDYARANDFLCVRGSKDNVLKRFTEVIKQRQLDLCIRLTGDNPIVLVDVMDAAIRKHIEVGADYTRNNNLPYGTSFEIINAQVLNALDQSASLSTSEREHVTLFIKNNRDRFKILEIDHSFAPIDFRFTVDYPSDYAAMNFVFQHLRKLDYNYNYQTLSELIRIHPWLSDVNGDNEQKKQFADLNSELGAAIQLLEKLEYAQSAKILKQFLEERNS